jgi:hypothetical protein
MPDAGGVGYGQEGATGLRGLFKGRATCFAGEQVAQGSTGTGKGGLRGRGGHLVGRGRPGAQIRLCYTSFLDLIDNRHCAIAH